MLGQALAKWSHKRIQSDISGQRQGNHPSGQDGNLHCKISKSWRASLNQRRRLPQEESQEVHGCSSHKDSKFSPLCQRQSSKKEKVQTKSQTPINLLLYTNQTRTNQAPPFRRTRKKTPGKTIQRKETLVRNSTNPYSAPICGVQQKYARLARKTIRRSSTRPDSNASGAGGSLWGFVGSCTTSPAKNKRTRKT